MPGVIEVGVDVSVGKVIEDILLILECGLERELEGQIQSLPL